MLESGEVREAMSDYYAQPQSVLDTDPADTDIVNEPGPWMDFEMSTEIPMNSSPRLQRTPDFAMLLPLDFPPNVDRPTDLDEHQLSIIAPAVAQITLQVFCYYFRWWTLYYHSHVDDIFFQTFRRKLFTILTKLVLTLYDLEDFQRCVDETNINKSCLYFHDHLSDVYGTKPESFLRAMTDISEGKLDFSPFPFLWEQDVSFALELYQLECNGTIWSQRPRHVLKWPFVSSPIEEEYVVFENHLMAVREALGSYVPLTEEEKMDLMKEMEEPLILKTYRDSSSREVIEEGLRPLLKTVCLEPWRDIDPDDLDKFNAPKDSMFDRDFLFPRTIFNMIHRIALKKATEVRWSKMHVTFPLRSGAWGTFADEVLEVVETANLIRISRRQRLLSVDLILSAIRQSRIADQVNDLLCACEPNNPAWSKNCYDKKYPIYYIYSLARDVASILGYDGSNAIKLEHVVLAIVFGGRQWINETRWRAILRASCVVDFLAECDKVCASGASPPSSPGKKKLKISRDIPSVVLSQDDLVSWDHMERLVKVLKSDSSLSRQKIFERIRAEFK